MAEYTVHFGTYAGQPITVNVDIDADMDRDEARQKIEDAAWQKLHINLCHQCAGHIDLGDFEPQDKITGFDEDA
jgi:hypothetical protein